jgi:hypothetical protein
VFGIRPIAKPFADLGYQGCHRNFVILNLPGAT